MLQANNMTIALPYLQGRSGAALWTNVLNDKSVVLHIGGQYDMVVVDHRREVFDAVTSLRFQDFPDAFCQLALIKRLESNRHVYGIYDFVGDDIDPTEDLDFLDLFWWVYDFNGADWVQHPDLGFDGLPSEYLYTGIHHLPGILRPDLEKPKKMNDVLFMTAKIPWYLALEEAEEYDTDD